MIVVGLSIIGTACYSVADWNEEEFGQRHDESHSLNHWDYIELIATVILTLEYVVTIFMVRNKCR